MSSSDDFRDKQLKAHFQGMFEDFEQQPSTATKRRIWQHIPKSISAYRRYGILAIGLLLIGTGLYFRFDQRMAVIQPGQLLSSQSVTNKQPKSLQTSEVIRKNELGATSRSVTGTSQRSKTGRRPISLSKATQTTDFFDDQKIKKADNEITSNLTNWRLNQQEIKKNWNLSAQTRLHTPQSLIELRPSARIDVQKNVTSVPRLGATRTEPSVLAQSTAPNESVHSVEPVENETRAWWAIEPIALHRTRRLQTRINWPLKFSGSSLLPVESSKKPVTPALVCSRSPLKYLSVDDS